MTDIAALTSTGTDATRAGNSRKQLADDFDTFLTLLTAQLQYQDPLQPTDTNEFTNQLVQFTNVEQQIQQNQNLEELIGLFRSESLAQATGFLGKQVTAGTDIATNGPGGMEWHYDLAGNSAQTVLNVVNASGLVVHRAEGQTDAGSYRFAMEPGSLPPGNYRLTVSAKNGADIAIGTRVYQQAEVTAVEVQDGQARLMLGNTAIPLGLVTGVTPTTVAQ